MRVCDREKREGGTGKVNRCTTALTQKVNHGGYWGLRVSEEGDHFLCESLASSLWPLVQLLCLRLLFLDVSLSSSYDHLTGIIHEGERE